MYGQTLVDLGYDAMARTQLITGFAREIENFAPHYLEEMRGIAAGADVSFEDIVMVNARTEVIAKARAEKKKAAELEPGDGCTGAMILPTRSANGRLIHGQNWDWRAECAETAIVLRVRNDNGPDILTFVRSGRPGAQRPEQRRRLHHRQLPGIRPRFPPVGRAAVADPPQGAGTGTFCASHQDGGDHAQVLLQQHR